VRCELDLSGSGEDLVVDSFHHGNEYLQSITGGKFLVYMNEY